MKFTKIILLILSILAVGFLAGCEDESNEQESSPDEAATNETFDLDNEYKNAALELLDESYCEKINDTSIKETCKIEVSDQKIEHEAKLRGDATICEQLSTEIQRESCKLRLEVAEKKDDVADLPEDEMAIYTQAVKENKPELCETLQNTIVRDSCIASFVNKT
jgi:hypothetical protein